MSKETVTINWKNLTRYIHLLSSGQMKAYRDRCKKLALPDKTKNVKPCAERWLTEREKELNNIRIFLGKFLFAVDLKKEYEVILKENESKI